MTANRWNFPDLGLGLGLRTVHYKHILASWPKVDFFEIVSENFMDTGGRPLAMLERIAERYPIIVHGVSMSIGSTDPLNFEYLGKLKRLAHRVGAQFVSDHVCWTGCLGRNTHDLLPIPLSEESLAYVTQRIRQVQDYLELPVVMENPSTYVEFLSSSMPEWEFMSRMADDADCGLLLDVNNVFVSGFNHGFDPFEYIEHIPADRIVYHHVAGHTNMGTHILDTHSDHVLDPVWELYRRCHQRTGGRTTLLEWDANIPSFETVHEEVLKALKYRGPLGQLEFERRVAAARATDVGSPEVAKGAVDLGGDLPGVPVAAPFERSGSPEAARVGAVLE